jgi:hypothetical protein
LFLCGELDKKRYPIGSLRSKKKENGNRKTTFFDELLFVHVSTIVPNVGRRYLRISFLSLSFSSSHHSAMSMVFMCRIQTELPLSVATREREQDMPPCKDPRMRAVHCPGGCTGFYGRFFSHVPHVTTRGVRGCQLQHVLCAV